MDRNTQILSADKRKKYFQIDCPSEIIYSGWKPDGRVYTKQLLMKNVGNQLITLTYKLPEMACFFTPYPDQIVLPVGMEHAITVSFQPVNPVEVESELVFFCNQHKEHFVIKLRGDLPLLSASINQQVSFPTPTAVAEQQELSQVLKNDGEVPFLFDFKNESSLFEINPSSGALDIGQKISITYTFKPLEAGQIFAQFYLQIRKADLDLLAKVEKVDYEINIIAVSKFPFIRTLIDDSYNAEVDFTKTPILSEVSKQVILFNDSPVACSFRIDDDIVSDKPYNQIRLTPSQGIIGAKGKYTIMLKYKPAYTSGFYKCIGDRTLDQEEYDEEYIFSNFDPQSMELNVQFKIITKSNASTVFTVRASASPTDIQLSHTKIELGTIACGQSIQKSIYLKNNSKFSTPYEFICPGLTSFPGVCPDAEVDSEILRATDLLDVTRSRNRKLQDFPLLIHPNSGIATSQINTTIEIKFNLSKFTCKSDDLTQNTANLTFIPPQPISIFIQLKTPGAPVQFIHLTATILPEKGLDCRPAPITMKYAEKWNQISQQYNIDQLMGMMLPFKNEPAFPMNSPLYNHDLPEFETEYASKVNLHDQSLVREIEKYDIRDLEVKPNSNALLPSDSLLQEFQYKTGNNAQYPAKISDKSINFGYVPFGTDKQKVFSVFNTSERMNMYVGLTGLSNLKNAIIEFIGLSAEPFFQSKENLQPFYFEVEDGLEYRTALTKGLVAKIPPTTYGFFQVTFKPSQPDESFYTKFALFCVHHPLLLYRCFRHAIVGTSFIQEIRIAGFSRNPDQPSLLSSIPLISKPVIADTLFMPPAGPGSVSRTTFAFTNIASTFIVISLSPLLYKFVQVTPEIIGLHPKQTAIVSVCITFPRDAIANKEKYGFTYLQNQQNQVQFDDILVFSINGSQVTRQDIRFQAICAGVDVVLDKVNDFEQIVASQQDKNRISNVVMRMAPVSLGSEANRFFTLVNKSLLPCHINFEACNQRDSQLMYTQPNDLIAPGCEFTQFSYTLRAMEKFLQEQAYMFDLDVNVEIPSIYSVQTPKNLLLNTKLAFSSALNTYNQKLSIQTSIARRTVDLTPKTVNLGPIVPYTSIDVPIQIYNSSHCSISYTLEIHEIFNEMPSLPFEKTHKTARKYSYTSANENGDFLVPSLYNKLYDTESVMSTSYTDRCPQVFIRSGAGSIILPQSSNNAIITIMPFSTRPVRARIYAKIVEIESFGRKFGEVINELEQKSVYIQGTANALNSIISKEKELFECKIEVSADYPKFFISDISCPSIGSNQMRDIMEVDSINQFLANDVTMAERVYVTPCADKEKLMEKLIAEKMEQSTVENEPIEPSEGSNNLENSESEASNQSLPLHINPVDPPDNMKDFTQKQNQKPSKNLQNQLLNIEEKLLQEFPIVLGPDNRSDGKFHRINLTLANPSCLPVEVSIELPSEHPSLDSAPWAAALPSQKQQVNMSLLARRIFTVSPEKIYLKQGEKQSISVTYSHQEEGVHELVVLVKILGGRTFFFHLVGQTLAEDEPALIAPVEFKLLPVAVGEVVPPRQFLKMNNPGNVPVSYKLVNPEFIFADQENDGVVLQQATKILRCLNPVGFIAPQSSIDVILQFQPNQIGLVQIKYDLIINTKQKENVFGTGKKAQKFFENECTVDLPDENVSFVNANQFDSTQVDEDSKVYQTLSIIGYGFIPQSTIPQLVVPSHSLVGSPLNPACGAVSILQNQYDDLSALTTQRGLGICFLSCGRLVLGAVPVFGVVQSIIEIQAADTVPGYKQGHFTFEINQSFKNSNLNVHFTPSSGTLQFSEKQKIYITISTGSLPSVFLEDIPIIINFVPNCQIVQNFQNQENFSRLPVVLANTVASAARISETAILQQFDPSEINKAGLDQAGRSAHAMLYGVDDRVSKIKFGPLSQYANAPISDVLWLTVTLHSHRGSSIQFYQNCDFGLGVNLGAIMKKGVENGNQIGMQELSAADSRNLANLVGNSLRSAVGKLASEEESRGRLLQAAKSAKRDAVNGLNSANFFEAEFDDPVEILDSEVEKRVWEVQADDFLESLSQAVFEEV